jgi:hypothetical protein
MFGGRKRGALEAMARAARAAMLAFVAGVFLPGIHAWSAPPPDRIGRIPRVVLWAWERRENLTFINPSQIAVAYLDRTLELSGNTVVVRPRFEPLTVPARAILIPVARIEIDRRSPPSLSRAQRMEAARIIAAMSAPSLPPEIQIDFDVTRSQRAFYRDLLIAVRERLPESTALSITALASWCMDDDWMSGLPVDEIVPMVYRMGPDAPEIISDLHSKRDFAPAVARLSVGLSTDEQFAGLGAGKRIYLFSPRPWAPAEVRHAIAEANR